MNRRSFLKMLGLGMVGFISPNLGKEWNKMGVGRLFAKMGRGEVLTVREQQEIERWGDTAELHGDFTAGIQTGQSNIVVGDISAQSGNFKILPNHSSIFWGDNTQITGGVDAYYSFGNANINPESIFIRYDNDNTKFHINPIFVSYPDTTIMLNVNCLAVSAVKIGIYLEFFYKSNDASLGVSTILIQNDLALFKESGFVPFYLDDDVFDYYELYFKVRVVFPADSLTQITLATEKIF